MTFEFKVTVDVDDNTVPRELKGRRNEQCAVIWYQLIEALRKPARDGRTVISIAPIDPGGPG